jgi:hypothetical protein
MSRLRLYLGIVIAAPVTVLTGLLYVLPFWLLGWHKLVGVKESTSAKSPLGVGVVWALNEKKAPKWLTRMWAGWGGHCVGSWVVLCRPPEELERSKVLLNHELHHVHQMHTLGALQPILYMLSSITAWAAGEKAYTANHFEVAARRVAGQVVDAQSFTQGFAWCKGNHK